MKVMNHTEEQQTENKTSLSKGERRNQVLRRITVVGVIAAVITAAFAGYCLHRERVEEKQKAEELRKEKQDKKEAAKVKSKPETAEQKLERIRKQATEHGYPKNVIELLDKNVETVDFVADYEKKKDKPYADTIGKDLPELKWRGKMNPLICEPGELLEIGDRGGVVRLLEYHLKRLDMEIEKRTAETSEKKKLGSWLGAAGGIFLVILLL